MSSTSGAERLKKSKEKKKEVSREMSRRHRLRRSSSTGNAESKESLQLSPFPSRIAKKRTMDAVSDVLPNTPEKKASIVTSLINSPRTRKILEDTGVILPEEDQKNKFWRKRRARFFKISKKKIPTNWHEAKSFRKL